MAETHDPDLQSKTRRATGILSENLHFVANEPSLAFYRLQEHVRKSVPPMIEKRVQVQKLHKDLQGHYYDVEYALGAANSIKNCEESLNNIQEQLKNALFLSQQIKYEHTRRGRSKKDSMYKRLSAHITTTLDLPELPEAIRDTANKVESMFYTTLETLGLSLAEAIGLINNEKTSILNNTSNQGKQIKQKFETVTQSNYGYTTMETILKIIEGNKTCTSNILEKLT